MRTEWIVTETSPYSGEKPVRTTYPSVEEARAAVEKTICELLAGENAPVAAGDQVGRMSEANEPRSGLKSPRPHFDPTDVYWPDVNRACIGDEITWKIEPHETPTRKETDMNKLRNEVRAIIENYNPKADFEETLLKLASVGYKMEETMMHT